MQDKKSSFPSIINPFTSDISQRVGSPTERKELLKVDLVLLLQLQVCFKEEPL
jgi:hypothetical protein